MRMPVWRINRKTLPPRSLRRRNSCWRTWSCSAVSGAWESLGEARNILAADEMSEFGKLFGPRQFVEDGAQSDKPEGIGFGRQRRHLGVQACHPAEDMVIPTQLVEAI